LQERLRGPPSVSLLPHIGGIKRMPTKNGPGDRPRRAIPWSQVRFALDSLSDRRSTRIAGRNLTISPALIANYHPMREADHVYKDRPGRFREPGDARGRRTLACHNCLHLRDRFWDPRLSGAGATVLAADPHLGTGKADPWPSNSAHWQGRRRLPPLGSAYHHIDLAAAAAGTDQPLAPIEHGRFGAVPLGHLGRIGLYLMPAILAPNDQPDAGRGSVAERHRRAEC